MSTSVADRTTGAPIAIIGIGIRVPEADNVASFWELVCSGRQTFRVPTAHERELAGDFKASTTKPNFVAIASTASDIDGFDADFFGITPHEATSLDPQQRLALEAVWQALEDSGHAGDYGARRVGVFASVTSSTYLAGPLTGAGQWDPADPTYSVMVGNDKDFLASRISYVLGFGGPAINVQTACSSSLVAAHLAARSLEADECDLAIVVGTSLSLPHLAGYIAHEGSIFSRTGNCRPFDRAADGTVKANGAAAVVLRRTADAQEECDRIYAAIVGSGISNDGAQRVGFSAPGNEGQKRALASALATSGLEPNDVTYVETHGTGTFLGDQIELRSLSAVYGSNATVPCHLGSLKGTMGHLDVAAGVASLAKSALIVWHRVIPPMAGITPAGEHAALRGSRFRIPQTAVPVTDAVVGVSSFGMGGTNAHILLAAHHMDAPAVDPSPDPVAVSVFGVDADATRQAAQELARRLRKDPPGHLADVAAALARGRRRDRFEIRVTSDSVDTLANALDCADPVDHDRRPAFGVVEAPVYVPHRWFDLPLTNMRRTMFWPVSHATVTVGDQDTMHAVAELMGQLLSCGPLEPEEDFFAAGADSMLGIELVGRLEDDMGVRLQYADLEVARTPRAMAALCSAHLALEEPAEVLVTPPAETATVAADERPQPAAGSRDNLVRITCGEGPNIFVIHPAGGTTSCYVTVCQQLRDRANFWGLNFPTELRGTAPSLRRLAEIYIDAIKTVQPAGPYRLIGYSFGGNLGVEMAVQLENAGEQVEHLVLIDAHPPHAYLRGRCGREEYLAAFPHLLGSLLGSEVVLSNPGPFQTPEEVLAALDQPVLSDTVKVQMAGFFDIWCDNHTALKRWLPDQQPHCPITVFEATVPEPPEVLEILDIRDTLAREWSEYLPEDCTVMPIEGDHYSIFRTPEGIATLKAGFAHVCS